VLLPGATVVGAQTYGVVAPSRPVAGFAQLAPSNSGRPPVAANADETAGKEETPLLGSGMVGAPREEIRLGLARLCAFLFEFFPF